MNSIEKWIIDSTFGANADQNIPAAIVNEGVKIISADPALIANVVSAKDDLKAKTLANINEVIAHADHDNFIVTAILEGLVDPLVTGWFDTAWVSIAARFPATQPEAVLDADGNPIPA